MLGNYLHKVAYVGNLKIYVPCIYVFRFKFLIEIVLGKEWVKG